MGNDKEHWENPSMENPETQKETVWTADSSVDNQSEGQSENNGFCETVEENSEKWNNAIVDSFWISKDEVLTQLAEAKNIEQSVKVFAKWADKYGVEAVLSLIPCLWDAGPAIISTCYLLYKWHKAWLETKDMLKVFGYQAADFALWIIPRIWNVIDFFYWSNVRSSKVFEGHVEKLVQLAKEKWATQEEIDEVCRRKWEMLHQFDEHLKNRSDRQKKANERFTGVRQKMQKRKEERKQRKRRNNEKSE